MKFEDMFNQIKEYHVALGYDFDNASVEQRIEAIRNKGLALNQEVAELIDSFPWKPWRKIEDQKWDTINAIEEVVDCLFFLVGICEAAHIRPNQIIDMLTYKLSENYDRINRGYNNKPEDR